MREVLTHAHHIWHSSHCSHAHVRHCHGGGTTHHVVVGEVAPTSSATEVVSAPEVAAHASTRVAVAGVGTVPSIVEGGVVVVETAHVVEAGIAAIHVPVGHGVVAIAWCHALIEAAHHRILCKVLGIVATAAAAAATASHGHAPTERVSEVTSSTVTVAASTPTEAASTASTARVVVSVVVATVGRHGVVRTCLTWTTLVAVRSVLRCGLERIALSVDKVYHVLLGRALVFSKVRNVMFERCRSLRCGKLHERLTASV